MGCVIKRPSNGWNFVTANVTNSVLVTDLGGNIEYCSFTLDAPSNLVAITSSSSEVNLTWTSNSGGSETGFSIERSLDGVVFVQIVTVGTGVSVYSDTGLTGGNIYYYRVRALGNIPSAYSNISSAYVFENQEALDWVDLMSNPTLDQQQRIDIFVGAEKAAGNWALRDFYKLCDLGSVNSLVMSNGVVATLTGTLSYEAGGTKRVVTSDGYENLNVALNTMSQYSLDDASFGGFIYNGTDTQPANVRFNCFGGAEVGAASMSQMRLRDGASITVGVNSGGVVRSDYVAESNDTYYLRRNNSSSFQTIKNGAVELSINKVSSHIPVIESILYAIDAQGTISPDIGLIGWSVFSVGADIGFDYTAHDTNIRSYLGV